MNPGDNDSRMENAYLGALAIGAPRLEGVSDHV